MTLASLTRVLSLKLKNGTSILASAKIFSIQSANMTSKEFRDPNIKKPKPWPYETRKYRFIWGYIDGTIKRFDENTKIIVVDGNIGAGKSAFAKQLADAFDMIYMPEPNLDRVFKTAYGYDLREIDELLPPSYKCCDINTFYSNPHHRNVGRMQFLMYLFRLEQYVDALAHLLNTGQGVVLERSVYSDFVFMQTMHKFGYVSDGANGLYNEVVDNTLDELLRPHLVVYLDISPECALERIKQRNNPAEVNSKVLTKEYLASIEHYYKQHYLKKMQEHAEILIYDWSNYGDVEVVVEDIERIDFERFTKYETQMEDWRKEDDWEWNYFRRKYTMFKDYIIRQAYLFRPKVADMTHPAEEVLEFEEIIDKIPGEKYCEGFNPAAGDNVWFKLKHKGYRHLDLDRH